MALYITIAGFIVTARDPKLFISMLVVAPVSLLVINFPAIVAILRRSLTSVTLYSMIFTTVSNLVLVHHASYPAFAVIVCGVNACILYWFSMSTDRYDKTRLMTSCESASLSVLNLGNNKI